MVKVRTVTGFKHMNNPMFSGTPRTLAKENYLFFPTHRLIGDPCRTFPPFNSLNKLCPVCANGPLFVIGLAIAFMLRMRVFHRGIWDWSFTIFRSNALF